MTSASTNETAAQTAAQEEMNPQERAMFERFGLTPNGKRTAFRRTLATLDAPQFSAVCWCLGKIGELMTERQEGEPEETTKRRDALEALRAEVVKGPDEARAAFESASDAQLDGIGWVVSVTYDYADGVTVDALQSLTRKHVEDCGISYEEYTKFFFEQARKARKARQEMIQRFLEAMGAGIQAEPDANAS